MEWVIILGKVMLILWVMGWIFVLGHLHGKYSRK